MYIIPHIFVWGYCFWLCTSASPPRLSRPPPLTHTSHSHTTCHNTTYSHNTTCHHTTYSHTTCHHTTCHHTTCPRTTYSHTTCPRTTCPHTTCSHTTLRGTRGTYGAGLALAARLGTLVAVAVCVAGMALGDIDLHFAWQAWHLATSTFTLRRWRGTW